MGELGYGKGYQYARRYPNAYIQQEYLPEKLKGRVYYRPTERGFEKIIKSRLQKWREAGKKKPK